MKIRGLFVLVVVAALSAAACGGSSPAPAETSSASAAAVNHEAEGQAVAKEILDTFNAAVAETAALLKDKPAPAAVKPQLQALFGTYSAKMTTINAKRRALTDVEARGAASRYMDEHRPKAVTEKDNALGAFIFHYLNTVKDADVADFLNTKIVTLIDIGDAH